MRSIQDIIWVARVRCVTQVIEASGEHVKVEMSMCNEYWEGEERECNYVKVRSIYISGSYDAARNELVSQQSVRLVSCLVEGAIS